MEKDDTKIEKNWKKWYKNWNRKGKGKIIGKQENDKTNKFFFSSRHRDHGDPGPWSGIILLCDFVWFSLLFFFILVSRSGEKKMKFIV